MRCEALSSFVIPLMERGEWMLIAVVGSRSFCRSPLRLGLDGRDE